MNDISVEKGKPLRGQGISVYLHKKTGKYTALVKQRDGRFKTVGNSDTYKGALKTARRAKTKLNGSGGLLQRVRDKKGEAHNAADLAAAVWLLEKTIQELITELRKM